MQVSRLQPLQAIPQRRVALQTTAPQATQAPQRSQRQGHVQSDVLERIAKRVTKLMKDAATWNAPSPPSLKEHYPESILGMWDKVEDTKRIWEYHDRRTWSKFTVKDLFVTQNELDLINNYLSHFHNEDGEVVISQEKYPELYEAYQRFKSSISETPSSFSRNA